jgi:Holliday junction resolvasome RuvABC endonuclease subunit
MLYIPSDTPTSTCIVGIDPGSETLGCAVMTFDIRTFEILKIQAQTYYGSRLPRSRWQIEVHGERTSRIWSHETNLLDIFNQHMPIAIVCESPFINMRRPQAYSALTEVVCAIRSAVHQYDIWRPLYLVEPSVAKKVVGAKGNADKDEVRQAIRQLPELFDHIENFESLDEHSVDAIAVAYSQYLLYKFNRMSYI